VTDILAQTSQPRPSWSTPGCKIWNGKAYDACSNMPRFGHMGILDEKQIRARHGAAAGPAARPSNK
jgi:hypothetical protein